jgi:methionyl-tRNA synthetase
VRLCALCQANGGLLAKEGISPQEVIDKYDGIIRKSFIDFDNYSRTSAKIT